MGYAEIFGYAQMALAIAALGVCYFMSRMPVYIALAIVMFIILLDDSFQLHELLGEYMAAGWSEGTMLRARDWGELIVWGLVGIFSIGGLAAGFLYSDLRRRAIGMVFLAMLILLASFAVGVDMVHSLLNSMTDSYKVDLAVALIEDGGEMMVISLICATALTALVSLERKRDRSVIAARRRQPPAAARVRSFRS